MIVRIAEIEALAAPRPIYFAFDSDAAREQVFFPRGNIFFRYSKCDVQVARGVVRGNYAARRRNRFQCSAGAENEKHLLVRDAEHAQALAGFEQTQSELLLVKANRAGKIARVKASLNDAVEAW